MLKLEFNIPPSDIKINLQDPIYLLGSCFSDNIGSLLIASKFRATINPFGTLYNPISIFKHLSGSVSPEDITRHQDVFYHWDCHGAVSALTKEALFSKYSDALDVHKKALSDAKWIMITLGTSWVYSLAGTDQVVANCHKHPASSFNKRLLGVEEVVTALTSTIRSLSKSGKRILLTVSPVRHIRDGLVSNNRSKAILLEAVHQLVEGNKNCYYFPSYEIVIDELRDYRFYKDDMIHPADWAINYIWKQFQITYFDDQTLHFIRKWEPIQKALHHRPFHPSSTAHQTFLRQTLHKLTELASVTNLEAEIERVKSQMI